MHVYLKTAVSILKVIAITYSPWVAGQLISSEVGIMRGEAIVLSEWECQVLAGLLKRTIEGWCVLRDHELAEIIEGDSLLLGEVCLSYRCGCFSFFLVVFEKIGEILNGEVLFHIIFQWFYFFVGDLLVGLLELQAALHQLHYALKFVESNLSVVRVLFLTHEVHNCLELLVFLHSQSA